MFTSKWVQRRRVPPEGGGLLAMMLRRDPGPETLARPLPCVRSLGEPLFPLAAACLAPRAQNVPKLLMLPL